MRLTVRALLLVLSTAAPASASGPAETPVTWNFEAPDMSDVADFNESGQVSVPLVFAPTRCGEKVSVSGVHMYQYITGSTRGSDRKPGCLSSGVVISLGKPDAATQPPRRLKVTIEAGEDDWTGNQSFQIPAVSDKQWKELAAATSWVFEVNGMTLPRFWKRVVVSCE